MAEALWLCSKSLTDATHSGFGGTKLIDTIVACLINADDGSTEAEAIADAVGQCQAAGHAVYDDYFASAVIVGTPEVSGELDTDLDCYIFMSNHVQYVAAPA